MSGWGNQLGSEVWGGCFLDNGYLHTMFCQQMWAQSWQHGIELISLRWECESPLRGWKSSFNQDNRAKFSRTAPLPKPDTGFGRKRVRTALWHIWLDLQRKPPWEKKRQTPYFGRHFPDCIASSHSSQNGSYCALRISADLPVNVISRKQILPEISPWFSMHFWKTAFMCTLIKKINLPLIIFQKQGSQ